MEFKTSAVNIEIKEEGDKASSEAPEEKNPYQQVWDLPDNEFMDFIEDKK